MARAPYGFRLIDAAGADSGVSAKVALTGDGGETQAGFPVVRKVAHAGLFVLAQRERLCTNPDHERHAVRVRPDARPMNGILHSLHVMGRVVGFFDRLLADGLPWRSGRSLLLERVASLRLGVPVADRGTPN